MSIMIYDKEVTHEVTEHMDVDIPTQETPKVIEWEQDNQDRVTATGRSLRGRPWHYTGNYPGENLEVQPGDE